jgi:hypothetical protein
MTDQPTAVTPSDPSGDRPAPTPDAPFADPFAAPIATPFGDPPTERSRGRVPAWVAVLVALIALVVGAGVASVAVWSYEHSDDVSATVERLGVPASGTLYFAELEPGVCFDDMPGDAGEEIVGDVRARSCAAPHDYQAYATFNLPEQSWPGDDAIDSAVEARCEQEHAKNVALAKVTDDDQLTWWTPTKSTWDDNDRYVICAVQGPRSQLLAPVPIA